MRRLPDSLVSVVTARALAATGRVDIVDVEFPEIDLVISYRAPSPEEWARYVPLAHGDTLAVARYNLLADCLVYPCDERGVPDLDALSKAVEALPAIPKECDPAELAAPAPISWLDVKPENMQHFQGLFPDGHLESLARQYPVLKVGRPEDTHKIKAIVVRKPPRASFDDYDGASVAHLVEKSHGLAIDCIVGMDDAERVSVLKYYPGLPIVIAPLLVHMGGHTGGKRKKVRRGASAG